MKRFDFSMKLIVLAVCAVIAVNLFYTPKTDIVSAEDTEMRGIWVASVGNLDYPQSPTADAWQLRVQMDEVLDNCQDMGFNTVFLQVNGRQETLFISRIYFRGRVILQEHRGRLRATGLTLLNMLLTRRIRGECSCMHG